MSLNSCISKKKEEEATNGFDLSYSSSIIVSIVLASDLVTLLLYQNRVNEFEEDKKSHTHTHTNPNHVNVNSISDDRMQTIVEVIKSDSVFIKTFSRVEELGTKQR